MSLREALLPLFAQDGMKLGDLYIRCLPNSESVGGMDLLEMPDINPDEDSLSVRLLEDQEYRYEIKPSDLSLAIVEPSEVFTPDDSTLARGRLKAGLNTGTVTVSVVCETGDSAFADLEIRSRKLDYLTDYRAMLGSIASESAELLMQRFSAARLGGFAPGLEDDALTLYQRFAFLSSILRKESFRSAVAVLLNRPHENFESEEELRHIGRGLRAGSGISRQFARATPRVATGSTGNYRFAPQRLIVDVYEPTFDTEPNRFVRMVYEHWRSLCLELRDAMFVSGAITGPSRRGVVEAESLIAELDEVLAHPVVKDVGVLTHMPIANQVLQQRAGYREVAELFVLTEAAAQLRWSDGEFVFAAGQRNVAELYEYWCYMQLRKILSRFCEAQTVEDELFVVSDDGISLGLRRGKGCVFSGVLERNGRRMRAELWFNKHFGSSGEVWATKMRPDCSVRITPDSALGSESPEVWLHFDAKYRVNSVKQILDEDLSDERGSAKRSDLLKMHAYKDAIRRTAGAYVLFPGGEKHERVLSAYRELLPGIGAFPFRIGADGDVDAVGTEAVSAFLDSAIDQVANQASDYERVRYWTYRAVSDRTISNVEPRTFIDMPPADTRVLLGYVKDVAHREWINKTLTYNLRADDRDGSVARDQWPLRSDLLILCGPDVAQLFIFRISGSPLMRTRDQMIESGYSAPKGQLYCLLQLHPIDVSGIDALSENTFNRIQNMNDGLPIGYPRTLSWSELWTKVAG